MTHGTVMVRETSPRQSVGGPASVLDGKPDEDLDMKGCPSRSSEPLGGESMEPWNRAR